MSSLNNNTNRNTYDIDVKETLKQLSIEHILKCIAHEWEIGKELRPLYCYKAFGKKIEDARIISFWACNFSCPYCKRDGNFRNADGSIISASSIKLKDVLRVIDDAIEKDQVVRFSGWDPIAYSQECLFMAEYVQSKGGRFSVAHNWSAPEFIKHLLSLWLESAAIDLKAPREEMSLRTGLKNGVWSKMYDRSLETQKIINKAACLLDVRTPIFSTTTLEDLLCMAEDIVAYKDLSKVFWTLRLYKPVSGCEWEPPRNKEFVIWMIQKVKERFPELKMGLRAKWEANGFLYY